jgi:predicted amidohydrolase YtcJ
MIIQAAAHPRALLVLADRVHTLAAPAAAREATALLLREGRVAAVGDAATLRAVSDDAELLDLRGSTITPGITDAHAHLTEWAFARREVDLSTARSGAEAARVVARHVAAHQAAPLPPDHVRGRGWNPHLWAGEPPHRALLDEIAPDTPVALQSHDMHALWVNSAALQAARIGPHTPDPVGGRIVRDADGEPTGLLLEWAGRLVTDAWPEPTAEQAGGAVLEAQAELHSLGITGIHSFPGIHRVEPDPLPVLLRLRETGELRLRVLQHIRLERLDDVIRLGLRSGFGDDWLRIGAVKLFLDGALGSRTAWMREPYEGGADCGMSTMDPAEFRDIVKRAAAAGLATTVHAIGDAAVCLALDVLADPDVRVAALPHRIEHLQCCPAERVADAAAAGIICSMQPSHLMTDWRIADRHWGARRSGGAYAFGSLLRHGTVLAFGSDVPVEPVDPRRGLYAAVTRQDLSGEPAAGWFPAERISSFDALRGYTLGPARAAGLPAPAGTLVTGAPADLAAWDRDPLGEAADLPAMSCVATVIGGSVAYLR